MLRALATRKSPHLRDMYCAARRRENRPLMLFAAKLVQAIHRSRTKQPYAATAIADAALFCERGKALAARQRMVTEAVNLSSDDWRHYGIVLDGMRNSRTIPSEANERLEHSAT